VQAKLIRPRASVNRSWVNRSTIAVLLMTALMVIAARSAQAADWPENLFNPQPLPDDVTLPMPCGGAMAFRTVHVPSDGPLSDRKIRVGETDDDRGYLDGARPEFVAGSFSDPDGTRTYLLGKYEVSRLQYLSLGKTCPTPTNDDQLPQTGVSWHDAIAFADQYSQWLRKNALDALPAEDGEAGYVRLPTGVEWEFAARGGIAVSESEFTDRVFPMPEGMARYVWFAGSQSSNGKVQRIGLLKPNPLGLHDMLGNVDEIVLDPFRLNKLDRLHGQPGGFVVRGGHFATSDADIRAASRQEVPFYQRAEPRRSKTTGFRLAVSSRVVTSRNRLRQIEDAWLDLGTGTPPVEGTKPGSGGLDATPLNDPIKELGVIAEAADDPNMAKRLKNLQLAFRSSFQARDEQRDRAAKARLRLGTFLCQKIRDDGLPIDRLRDVHAACVKARGADNDRCQNQQEIIDAEEGVLWENLRYYADTLVTLVDDYDPATLDAQLSVLRSELNSRGLQELTPVADIYRQHAQQFRKAGAIQRTAWLTDCKGS